MSNKINPKKILEDYCEIINTMKLIEDNPGKTTAELNKLSNISTATFYRHMAKVRSLELVEYRKEKNKTGQPIVHYPKYKIEVKRL